MSQRTTCTGLDTNLEPIAKTGCLFVLLNDVGGRMILDVIKKEFAIHLLLMWRVGVPRHY